MVRAALVVMIMAIMVGVGATLNLLPVSAQDTPTVTRSINPSTVAPNGEVTVTIRASNYGPAGSIVENFPSGFAWVSSTHPDIQVQRSGEQVTFTLFGETSFSYTLTASSTEGSHTFSGTLTDGNNPPGVYQVASRVTVQAAPPAQDTPTVTRSINPSTVAPSGEVTVTIRASNYGPAGSIVENFPSGFAWVSSTHPDDQVQRSGEQVTFTLFGETSFSYTLTASSTEGSHTFSGTLTDGHDPAGVHQVGASRVTVQSAAPPPPPLPPPPTPPDDRPGMVSFSMDMPKVGAMLTATLSDPNGGVAGTTWQWSRCDDAGGATCTSIANTNSMSYTPVDGDVDKYLKAMASYTDAHRPNRTAEAMTANAVAPTTTGSALGDHYDSAANGGNADGQLDTPEMLSAVRDYFAQGSTITVPQMLELVRIYFAS